MTILYALLVLRVAVLVTTITFYMNLQYSYSFNRSGQILMPIFLY